MKIIYMGTPDLAVTVLEALHRSEHEVVLAVTQPDRPKGRGRTLVAPPVKMAAAGLGIPVRQPEKLKDAAFIAALQEYQPDLIVVVAFSILPMSVIKTARQGAVNLHASLLPKYRGAAPIQWALYHGEPVTGVTIFKLDAKMDTGEILGQAQVPVEENDSTATLGLKIIARGTELMLQVLKRLQEGTVQALPQNDALATSARKLTKADGRIDWTRSARHIHNQVRAFNPFPICYAPIPGMHGKLLRIHETRVVQTPSPGPGRITLAQNGNLLAGCGEGCIELVTVQLEGKPRMDSRSFYNGLQDKAAVGLLGG